MCVARLFIFVMVSFAVQKLLSLTRSIGCVGAFQSAEWALVKWLTGTDEVVDQALNDQQSRK